MPAIIIALFALTGLVRGQDATDQPRALFGPTIQVQDITRLEGHGTRVLRGIGLVVGLPGTGDSGAELALARPLAEFHTQNGNPLADLRELKNAKSVALVAVEVVIPPSGARVDDQFDVTISAMHSANSLRGGQLLLTAMLPPGRGDDRVFAMARGSVEIEGTGPNTRGRISRGAIMTRNVAVPEISGQFVLVIDTPFRGWGTASLLANQISGLAAPLSDDRSLLSSFGGYGGEVAVALDESRIRVTIPIQERRSPANFIATVLSHRFGTDLLDLPASVIVNRRTGSIIVSGDVEITTAVISHRNLVVTTITPPPVPTAADPIVGQENWVGISTDPRGRDRARVRDLLRAFEALDVPMEDRIDVLRQLHAGGHLLGRLVVE